MIDRLFPFLEELLEQTRTQRPADRVVFQRRALAGVLAYEGLGVLSAEQAARWRERLTTPGVEALDPAERLDRRHRLNVERYLGTLLDQLDAEDQASRDATRARFDGALDAACAIGAISPFDRGWWEQQAAERHTVTLRARRTDLEADPRGPTTERQSEESPAQPAPTGQFVHRVIPGTPVRHHDLAIIAVVCHEDAVALHFHYLGEVEGDAEPGPDVDRSFQRSMRRLVPPHLSDDLGTVYTPIRRSPNATGNGGTFDPDRRWAITGHWLYTPPAPDPRTSFRITHDDVTCRLGSNRPAVPKQNRRLRTWSGDEAGVRARDPCARAASLSPWGINGRGDPPTGTVDRGDPTVRGHL